MVYWKIKTGFRSGDSRFSSSGKKFSSQLGTSWIPSSIWIPFARSSSKNSSLKSSLRSAYEKSDSIQLYRGNLCYTWWKVRNGPLFMDRAINHYFYCGRGRKIRHHVWIKILTMSMRLKMLTPGTALTSSIIANTKKNFVKIIILVWKTDRKIN